MTSPPDPAAHPSGPLRPLGVSFVLANGIDALVGQFSKAVVIGSGVLLTAIMTANVVARYVLSSGGFRWAQELPTLIFPFFIVAGIILAAQGGLHMAVEWLYDRFAARGKAMLFVFSHVCVIASFLTLAWQARVVAAIAGVERSPILGLPNSIGYYVVSVGALLVAVVTATATFRVARLGWDARPQTSAEELPL
ncbi:TRAP transporter small permease [Aureimonas sp. N4]|uniref:TRAP transporter small permease n=1 Tax=Aureimonas sp. N4 TaxID=1638165 RepID=UPI0009E9A17A|nr:TRAP transporter small permease subunit [Aureimonas sp. N4]